MIFDPARARPDHLVDVVASLEDAVAVPGIRELVERPQGATVAEVRAAAGGLVLQSGESLASVLAAMPADTARVGVAGAVATVAAHVATLLPPTP